MQKRKKPPPGRRYCVCKRLIPSDWGLCGECIRADQRRQAEGGREHRRMMAAVCREVNKQR